MKKIKKFKRFTAALILISILSGIFPCATFAEASKAYIIFGNSNTSELLTAELGNNAKQTIVERGGRDALYLSPFEAGTGCNLYCRLNDSFGRKYEDATSIEISVTYYDDGEGCFALVYDGIFNSTTEQDDFIVDMTDTGKWITHTFFIENPFFGGGVNGYDFAIMLTTTWMGKSTDYVTISSVEVKKATTKSRAEIKISSENPGNIFFKGDKISFETTFKSLIKEKFSSDIVYTVYDNKNNTVWKNTQQSQFENNEEKKIELEIPIEQYGVFKLKAEVISEEGLQYSSKTVPFSFINRERGLPTNDFWGACMHHTLTAETRGTPEIPLELLKNAGFGWVRSNIAWPTYERSAGTYVMMDFQNHFANLLTEKYDSNWLIVATDGNTLINVPRPVATDEHREKFADYVYNLTLDMKKRGLNYIQIWNEYNLSAASLTTAPEEYVKLLEVSYKAAKRANPDVVVAGLTTSGVPMQWIERVFKAGGINYMDVVTCHPYSWRYSPESGQYIKKLQDLKELCAQYGRPDIPIWVSELGQPSGTGNPNLHEMGNDLGDVAKAAYFTRQYILSRAYKIPDKLFIYEFHKGRHVRNNDEMNFGIIEPYRFVDTPYAATESYPAVANLNTLLIDADFTDMLTLNDDVTAYRFKRKSDNKEIIAIWSLDIKGTACLNLNTDEVTVYDMYGNSQKIKGIDGNYIFELSGETFYIEGEFGAFEKGKQQIFFDNSNIDAVPLDTIKYTVQNNTGININVSAEAGANTKLEKVENFEDTGKSEIYFGLTSSQTGNMKIRLTDDNGNIISEISPRINATDAVNISIDCLPYSSKLLTRWRGVITLKNNSRVNTVSGKIHFSAPDNITAKMPDIKIPELAPGETKTISVLFPEMMKKYKSYLAGELRLNTGYVQNFKLNIDFIAAPYASSPPNIDGVMEKNEWQRGSAIFIDKHEMVQMMTDWSGINDLSGKVYTKWDYDYLYMSSVINDDIHCQNEVVDSIWQGDSMQIGIECDVDDNVSAFTELTIALTSDGPQVYRNRAEGEHKTGPVENFEGVFKRDEEQKITVYELKIPWSELLPPDCEIRANSKLGFSLLINDNDGSGRRGWLEMTPGIGWYKNGEEFTRILLMK